MARFEIEGNEYELKLTYASAAYLDSLYEGGSLAVVGKALTGSLDTFSHIVHAALFHTEQNFSKAKVDKALEQAFEAEKLDLDSVLKISNEIVAKSFFYKKTVERLLSKDPKAKKAFEELLK